jgi:hypothetical protein
MLINMLQFYQLHKVYIIQILMKILFYMLMQEFR